jgi:hypothetical protein
LLRALKKLRMLLRRQIHRLHPASRSSREAAAAGIQHLPAPEQLLQSGDDWRAAGYRAVDGMPAPGPLWCCCSVRLSAYLAGAWRRDGDGGGNLADD